MRSFLSVAALTLVGFIAGAIAGIFYERHRPLPPPPVPFLSEFHDRRAAAFRHNGPLDRGDLIRRIDELRPQLDLFQHRMDEIDAEFDHNLDAVLRPDQQAKHAEDVKRHHQHRQDDQRPITDDAVSWMLRDQPARTVMWDVVIPFRLDFITKLYNLDDTQRETARGLLVKRRTEFLDLVDSSPPPSVALSRLAVMMQRLKQPPAPAGADGPPPGGGSPPPAPKP
ncbi:MAG TPA: hypothetical protein VGL42_11005 [Opitutaceae bacterium]|jgi:hypothetical protein